MPKKRIKFLATTLAVCTAINPIITYAANFNLNIINNNEFEPEQASNKLLYIKLKTEGGAVILNEGKSDEKSIRLEPEKPSDAISINDSNKDIITNDNTTEMVISAYDKDGMLISSEDAEDNNFVYLCETAVDKSLDIKAMADEGFDVTNFIIADSISEDNTFETGFKAPEKSFSHSVVIDSDLSVNVEFSKTEEISEKEDENINLDKDENQDIIIEENENEEITNPSINEDVSIDVPTTESESIEQTDEEISVEQPITPSEDVSIENNENTNIDININETPTDKVEEPTISLEENAFEENSNDILENNSDLNINNETDETDANVSADVLSDISVPEISENTNINLDTDIETPLDSNESQENPEDDNFGYEVLTNDKTGEHFVEADPSMATALAELNPEHFTSKRLILSLDKIDNKIVDPEHIISNYQDLYLMEYKSVEQAMNAYVYYRSTILTVEPDMQVFAATSNEVNEVLPINEINNPMTIVQNQPTVTVPTQNNLIALIDTGADGPNIVNKISVIDDILVGGTHGTEMANFIVEQNPNAQIMSIRALNDNGIGSTSSIIAAIRYAIDNGAKIINLSLYQEAVDTKGMLFAEIQNAINNGIIVVGSAGNNNSDVMNYLPGVHNEVYTIGAANKNGVKIESSNFGAYVDYNVVANSTSEAAAKFTGFISVNGVENIQVNNDLIYETNYMPYSGNQIVPDMNVYFICYENDESILVDDKVKKDAMEHILATGIHKFKSEITKDGYLRSYINPSPNFVDYNENGITPKVDIDRGAMGGIQKDITDECIYNPDEGYIDIPGKYAGLDLTVTVWQSSDSLYYHNLVPDEVKPEHHKGQQIALFQNWTDDWPNGVINDDYKAHGCNRNIKINGNLKDIEVGRIYNFGGRSTTKYIGKGGCDWSYLPGSIEYHNKGWAAGQVTTIRDCEEPMFNNIGTAGSGPLAGRNWLFALCVAPNTNNTFGEEPLVDGRSYVQCISKQSETQATFYIRVRCTGPSGQDAQSMGCLFTAEFTPTTGTVTISKKVGYADYMKSTDNIELTTEFTIYKDKACRNSVKVVPFKFGAGVPNEHVTISGLKPGIYYIKETGVCPGCMPDKNVYEFKIVAGKNTPTSSFVNVATGEPIGNRFWSNDAYKIKLNLTKTDDANKKLAGAVFRVQYKKAQGVKAKYTWFFKTGDGTNGTKLGEAHYHPDYLLDTWTNPRTGRTYTSSPLITTNGRKFYIPEGWVDIQEVMAPNEDKKDDPTLQQYKRDSKTYGFEIKGTKENTANFTNCILSPPIEQTWVNPVGETDNRWKVRVQVKKVNETLNPLSGAKFGVFYDPECTEPVNDKAYVVPNKNDKKYIITSGKDGLTEILTIANIPENQETITLYCKELTSPNGYAATEKPYKLDFSIAPFKEWLKAGKNPNDYEGELKFFGEDVGAETVWKNSEGWKVNVNLKKINENKEPLQGAVFEVFIGEPKDGLKIEEELISGPDGMSNTISIGVPLDKEEITITCREKTPPAGYSLINTVYYIKFLKSEYIAPDGQTKTFGIDNLVFDTSGNTSTSQAGGIINFKGWQVQVDAKKVDGDKKPVPGAVFGVYSDASCTTEPLGTMTSNDAGLAGPCSISVPNGQDTIELYCKELTPPTGYEPSTDIEGPLVFTKKVYEEEKKKFVNNGGKPSEFKGELKHFFKDGLINITPTGTPKPTDPPNRPGAGVHVIKTSSAAKDILDLESYTLEGAEFEIYGDYKVYSEDGSYRVEHLSKILKTDKFGISNSVTLPNNSWYKRIDPPLDTNGKPMGDVEYVLQPVTTNYYVKEIKPPKGHKPNLKVEPVVVTMPRDENATKKVSFKDEPIFCQHDLDIEKLGVKGNKLDGVVFKVEFFDSKVPNPSTLKRTWYLETKDGGQLHLQPKYLTTRLGYKSDKFFEHDGKVVIPIDGYIQLTEVAAPAEYVIEEEPFGFPTGETLEMKKRVYNDLKLCDVSIKKYESDGVTPLAGVEFELTFVEAAIKETSEKNQFFRRLLKEGESTIMSTDENGELKFEYLDQGRYRLTEVKTQPGHALLTSPIEFELPMKMTQQEANDYGNVDFSTGKEDVSYTDNWFFYGCLYEVTNNFKFEPPMTGSDGIWKYTLAGTGIATAMISCIIIGNSKNNRRKHKKNKRK